MKSLIPYVPQCETASLSDEIFVRRGDPKQDPNWKNSGASSIEEYDLWVRNICGIACLSMILKAESLENIRLIQTAKESMEYGAYQVVGTEVKGLFYNPFCQYIRERFGVNGQVFRDGLGFMQMHQLIESGKYVIASASPEIRHASSDLNLVPQTRGGHLVLITALTRGGIFYHDPSGLYKESQENAFLRLGRMDHFFAGRGMAISVN